MKKLIWILLLIPSISLAQLSPIEPTAAQIAARMAFYPLPKMEPTIEQQIYRYSEAEGVSGKLMLAIAKCESGLNPKAVSKTSDFGMWQINQVHFKEVKKMNLDLFDPIDNLKYALYLLKQSGSKNWSPSKHCWNKDGSFDG